MPILASAMLLVVVAFAMIESRPRIDPEFPSVELPPTESESWLIPGSLSGTTVVLVLAALAVCVAGIVRLAQPG